MHKVRVKVTATMSLVRLVGWVSYCRIELILYAVENKSHRLLFTMAVNCLRCKMHLFFWKVVRWAITIISFTRFAAGHVNADAWTCLRSSKWTYIGDIGLSRRSFIALALNYFILLSTKIVWWLSTRLNVNRGSGLYIEWGLIKVASEAIALIRFHCFCRLLRFVFNL